ncbi:MAG: DNA repair protein RecO [Cellvibrionaceae bacterium]
MRISLQPGYVLHRRPYRDTSLIVDFFTHDYGRVSAVAKGARQSGKKRRWVLEPFQPMLLSWVGKEQFSQSSLKQLHGAESQVGGFFLTGTVLYSALYLNELIVRLLPESEPFPELFQRYTESLVALSIGEPIEGVLRNFELDLLAGLGQLIPLDVEAQCQQPFESEAWYQLELEKGFVPVAVTDTDNAHRRGFFLGQHLKAISERCWLEREVRREGKRLLRVLLKPLLGARPLQSRSLFSR